MSWVRQGTISTVNGSTVVNGVDSLWSIGISPGASLYLVDGNGNPTAGPYEIASIQSNTKLTLAKPFPGTTGSARAYAIANTVGSQTVSALANDMTKFYGEISELLDQPQATPVANSIPVANSSGKIAAGWIPDATAAAKGVVQLATTAEAQAGTDATRAVTPATSGSRTTFAVTSTDDATSATSAPLKTAGGLAVAKTLWVGEQIRVGQKTIQTFPFANIGSGSIRKAVFDWGVDWGGTLIVRAGRWMTPESVCAHTEKRFVLYSRSADNLLYQGSAVTALVGQEISIDLIKNASTGQFELTVDYSPHPGAFTNITLEIEFLGHLHNLNTPKALPPLVFQAIQAT